MTPVPEEKNSEHPPLVWLRWAAPLAVALVTLIVFCPTLRYGFVEWDDPVEVTANPHIEGLSAEHLKWMFTNVQWVRRYQPLDWVSWGINYAIGGRAPFGYHLGNVLQHVTCAVLLYFFILRLLRAWRGGGDKVTEDEHRAMRGIRLSDVLMIAAAVGALAWSIHPLRAECVAWVTGRIYTQCAMFLLACFLCYVHAVEEGISATRRWLLHGLAVLFFVCSLLSYATVAGAAVGLLLLDIFPLRRFRGTGAARWFDRRAILIYLEKVPYLLGAGAVGIVTLWARLHVSQAWTPPPTLAQFSLFSRIMQAFYAYAYYLWIPFCPVNYLPVYTRLVGFNPTDWVFLLSAALVIGITVLAIALRKRAPWLAVAWGFHLLMLFPYLGLTEYPHYTNDRYAHFQGMMFSALLAGALVYLFVRFGMPAFRGALTVAGVVLVGLAALCYLHGTMWVNTETFFKTMIAELGNDPYRGDILWRLGDHYAKTGRVREALDAFEASIQITPQLPQPRQMKASLLIKLAEAAREGGAPPAQVNQLFLEAGRTLDALAEMRPAPQTVAEAGYAYGEAGDLDAALQRLEPVVQAAPEDAEFRLRYAKVLARSGKRDEALGQLAAAIKLSPQLQQQRAEIIASWSNPARSQPSITRTR
jgi:predicted negative regulator of RcsB-dependent stress response